MLRQEDAIGVVRPAGTGATDVVGTEAVTQSACGSSLVDVIDEAAHESKCGRSAGGRDSPQQTSKPDEVSSESANSPLRDDNGAEQTT